MNDAYNASLVPRTSLVKIVPIVNIFSHGAVTMPNPRGKGSVLRQWTTTMGS